MEKENFSWNTPVDFDVEKMYLPIYNCAQLDTTNTN